MTLRGIELAAAICALHIVATGIAVADMASRPTVAIVGTGDMGDSLGPRLAWARLSRGLWHSGAG